MTPQHLRAQENPVYIGLSKLICTLKNPNERNASMSCFWSQILWKENIKVYVMETMRNLHADQC